MKKVLLLSLVLAACARSVSVESAKLPGATAQLTNAAGQVVANATFRQLSDGVVIDVVAANLTPGSHGIHIHTVGTCEPSGATAFASAGGHFNPAARQHGLHNANGPHAGDLPNIDIDAQGKGTLHFVNNRVTLTAGPQSLLDTDGSALVIHAGVDDQTSDPAGNSGARIACGVIR